MQSAPTQPGRCIFKDCSHTCHCGQPCRALLRRQKSWSSSQSKLAPKARAQHSTSRQHVRRTRAVHSQSTVPALDQEFQAWWQNAGVAADALSPSEFAGLRGMAAASPINSGESIVTLPRTAALLVTPKMKCPFPDLIDQQYWTKCQWYEKMALMLLHERRQGKDSAVSGYIQQLPTDFDTLLHWTPEELQLLMYPHLLQQVEQQKQSWHGHYKNMQAASVGTSVSEEDLVWALECVRSRAFSGPYSGPPVKERARLILPFVLAALAYTQIAHLPLEQILNGAIAAVLFNIIYDTLLSRKLRWFAMCPVIDSMNHQSTSTNEVAYEYFGDRFSVTAERKYKQGEQVFITYGQQSNDKLLQYYGFVEPKNPADAYVVPSMLDALRGLPYIHISEDRVQSVQQAGLLTCLEQVALTRQGMPAKALQAVRMLLVPEQLHSQRSAADFEKQLDPLNEESCLQAVKDMCLNLNNQHSRIPARRSDAKASRQRQDLATAFRQQKSRVLQTCCKTLDNQIRQVRKT